MKTKKYMIMSDGQDMETEYEYNIGEEIRYNSTKFAKCIKKVVTEEGIYQYFEIAIPRYSYNESSAVEELINYIQTKNSQEGRNTIGEHMLSVRKSY
jgi:hypothetical protein